MSLENAGRRRSEQRDTANPERTTPQTDNRRSGGSLQTMTDPYRGQRRTPSSQEPGEAAARRP